jgi:competence protein ComEC
MLACCWSLWNFQARLDDRLPPGLTGVPLSVAGVVASVPQVYEDFVGFRFAPERGVGTGGLPRTLLLRWYREWPPLAAGQHWRLELVLKPPWGRVNFQGPDRERWLFAAGVGGLGTVRGGSPLPSATPGASTLQAMRQRIARQIDMRVEDERSRGIIRALALADRSGIAQRDRDVLSLTGTAHLLAISGLHIGLAAGGGVLLARLLAWFLPFRIARGRLYLLTAAGGMLAASAYAAIAGFGIPTVRSLLMLGVMLAALVTARKVHPLRAWLLALAGILLIDPFAPLAAGFWFSFMAVAGLLLLFAPRPGRRPRWQSLLGAQAAVMLVLLPVSAAWFQGFSPVGFLANLLAIPWVSFLVVPFVLAGTAALAAPGDLATPLWSLAGGAISLLWIALNHLANVQAQLTALSAPSLIQALLAVLGAALLLLPRGLPARWTGVFLLLPLFFPARAESVPGEIELDVLDVGQGTAVLVTTAGHTLLYDSGPGDGGDGNLVASVIVPALHRHRNGVPDRVVISHGDLDHAGGLGTLRERFPQAAFNANVPRSPLRIAGCGTPLRWAWNGVEFDVLHPSVFLPYLGNDSSCVLSVRQGSRGILLSGDISAVVERRLVEEGLRPHEVLLVPHHGSKTSSSEHLIAAVRPEVAVATAALGNRFGFPRASIRSRYQDAGAAFWSTGECGALRILLLPDGSREARSARRERPGVWRRPPAAGCP